MAVLRLVWTAGLIYAAVWLESKFAMALALVLIFLSIEIVAYLLRGELSKLEPRR